MFEIKTKFAAQIITTLSFLGVFFIFPSVSFSINEIEQLKTSDADSDGLTDYEEIYIYHTEYKQKDTDMDGYEDGDEVRNSYDPNKPGDEKLPKKILVSLKTQNLQYILGEYKVGEFKVSTGLKKTPTPPGEYQIEKKLPYVTYRGSDYFYPNTRWNMMFKKGSWGNFYIHGAYWHNSFGQPRSHGCVNVSYKDMEILYNWSDVGTKVVIE